MGRCDPGLHVTRELEVSFDDTAEAMGSGDVAVIATPQLLALAERACVEAIAGELPEGETSVGTWAEVEHLRATPVGHVLRAKATLIGHHGRRLEFTVLVDDKGEPVARISHRRIIVNRERFLEKTRAATPA